MTQAEYDTIVKCIEENAQPSEAEALIASLNEVILYINGKIDEYENKE